MKPTQICAGPPAGTVTKTEAETMGKPSAAGLPKRGVLRRGYLTPCGAALDEVITKAKAKEEKRAKATPGDELETTYGCPKCGRTDGRVVWVMESEATPDEVA